jgi:hypothetical protein
MTRTLPRADIGPGTFELGRDLGPDATRSTLITASFYLGTTLAIVDAARGGVVLLEASPPSRRELKIPTGQLLTGCPAVADRPGLLLATDRLVIEVSPHGHVRRSWPLPARPSCIAASEDSVAVGFSDAAAVAMFDHHGNIRYVLSRNFGDPQGLAFHDNALLVTDARRHVVVALSERGCGRVVCGVEDTPGTDSGRLNAPTHAQVIDNVLTVADGKNNRVLAVEAGPLRVLAGSTAPGARENGLWWPRSLYPSKHGIVVADGPNGRVVTLHGNRVIHLFGEPVVERAHIVHPRGAHFIAPDTILLTDSFGNAIVTARTDGTVLASTTRLTDDAGGVHTLTWPRFATQEGTNLIIVDGAWSGRVLLADSRGRLLESLTSFRSTTGRVHLKDPHHAQILESSLLLTDSPRNSVVEIGHDGRCVWEYGDLNDPHMAQRQQDGSTIIADTGNHRVIAVGSDKKMLWTVGGNETLQGQLREPRSFRVTHRGSLVILDSGNSQLLHVEPSGVSRIDVGTALRTPRYVDLCETTQTLVISDFDSHRLVFHHWRAGDGHTSHRTQVEPTDARTFESKHSQQKGHPGPACLTARSPSNHSPETPMQPPAEATPAAPASPTTFLDG